jgi:hypothetical protein
MLLRPLADRPIVAEASGVGQILEQVRHQSAALGIEAGNVGLQLSCAL